MLRPEREKELEVGGVDIVGRDGGRGGVCQARHGFGNRGAVGGQVITLLDAGGEDFWAVSACGTLGAEVQDHARPGPECVHEGTAEL